MYLSSNIFTFIMFKYDVLKSDTLKMVIFNKKGVSPLIATILLIAFAVALGSVIMNWGLHLNIGENADLCRNVEIKLRNIDDTSEACYGGFGANGYINFIVDNVGAAEVNGFSVWVLGDKSQTSISDISDILIRKGQLYDKNDQGVKYDFSAYGNIKSLQIIPKIINQGVPEACLKAAVKAEKIGICSNPTGQQ
jgi:flagellin-like protein